MHSQSWPDQTLPQPDLSGRLAKATPDAEPLRSVDLVGSIRTSSADVELNHDRNETTATAIDDDRTGVDACRLVLALFGLTLYLGVPAAALVYLVLELSAGSGAPV